MAEGTVRVRGYRETLRALERIQKGSGKATLDGLKEGAEPVKREWASRISRYAGSSPGTLNTKLLRKGILVRQDARKVSGRRPDYGALQMRLGLSALWEKHDQTVKAVEEALDDLTREAGF